MIIYYATSLETRLFADDTMLFYKCKTPKKMEDKVNSELQSLRLWLSVNQLSLNIAKLKFMIFSPKHSKYKVLSDISIQHTLWRS